MKNGEKQFIHIVAFYHYNLDSFYCISRGLWVKSLYHDNAFVKSAWYANDLITLFVVVPLLIIAIYLSHKNSQRWLMLLMGLLGYMFYNFAFYLFGAVFNIFFLIFSNSFPFCCYTFYTIVTWRYKKSVKKIFYKIGQYLFVFNYANAF